MEKLHMESPDVNEIFMHVLCTLFPEDVTEVVRDGKVMKRIDFDAMKKRYSDFAAEEDEERYQFTWPDKRKSLRQAFAPTTDTLRLIRSECVGRDGAAGGVDSGNLYIEGDNLQVLKLLVRSYFKRVKMIYIDPPYNTGKDFVYHDNFTQGTSDYKETSGQFDDNGNRLVQNLETNGRFHTDWLNMIYPRLRIARELLTDDGVIFISIDDNEVANLRKICDEIFGEQNFVAQVVWERAFAPVNLKRHFSESHDYVLCYSRNLILTECNGLRRDGNSDSRYSNLDNDPRGPWTSSDMTVGPVVPEKLYEIVTPSGKVLTPASGRCWLFTKERYEEMIKDNRIWFGSDGSNMPRVKKFLTEVKSGITPMTIWKHEDVGHSQSAAQRLKELFDGHDFFDYPKPVGLIERCLQLYSNKDSLVLDFFSGSATTAHAVMQLNAEDGGKRKFIMVQLPEACDEKSEAFKAGYRNICEIGKERIRRASRKIREENATTLPKDFDGGFRVLRLDSSNMQDVYYKPSELPQGELFSQVQNMKGDRTAEDFLFQVMLDLGVPLSAKIEETTIDGKKVFNVDDGFLVACFDDRATDATVTAIAKLKPQYAVLNDAALASDSVATNFEQIFATYSPTTKRRVI